MTARAYRLLPHLRANTRALLYRYRLDWRRIAATRSTAIYA